MTAFSGNSHRSTLTECAVCEFAHTVTHGKSAIRTRENDMRDDASATRWAPRHGKQHGQRKEAALTDLFEPENGVPLLFERTQVLLQIGWRNLSQNTKQHKAHFN